MGVQTMNDTLLDIFLFETKQLIEQLEQLILKGENESFTDEASINEIFRIMHTIKGSAAMMMFQEISSLAHSLEDIFYFIREEKPLLKELSDLSDLVLSGIDFIKDEIEKIEAGTEADGDTSQLRNDLQHYLSSIKENHQGISSGAKQELDTSVKKYNEVLLANEQSAITGFRYKAIIRFEDDCEMENVRAYGIIHKLKSLITEVKFSPEDILHNEASTELIRQNGFYIYMNTDMEYEAIYNHLAETIFLKQLVLEEETSEVTPEKNIEEIFNQAVPIKQKEGPIMSASHDTFISVSVTKLDKLLDLVGEMVISESMVIKNPDLDGLQLNRFTKAAQQLNKVTNEMKDIVMSIRMVPLSATFHKMQRLVRDISKKLDKEIQLVINGEETEVDKNIIEHISDPLMHLVRNALDHGIESAEERISKGKERTGTIVIEAKNSGSDVLIRISDDGQGLDKDKILRKAREQNLLHIPEATMTDRDIYKLILLPGFSTKESITEYSGRGVGMDVVSKNIEKIGGTLIVDSKKDKGTTVIMKIPLTLAIIDGMNARVGKVQYTIPTMSIKEAFRPRQENIINDPDNNEMLMVRGQCYEVIRLSKLFHIKEGVTDLTKGIIIMLEQDGKVIGLFVDKLLGQQQVVVKALPKYLNFYKEQISGISGCALLGDGSVSLILDIAGI